MTVKTLKSEAARQQWGEILDTARAGQEVIIERYNKPIAILLGFQEYEKLMQVFPLMLKFIEGDNQTDELNDLLAQIIAHKRLQEYLADPSIGIPYEEFHRRMVAEGVIDE
jgi:prevent-host-death family protein